MVFEIKKSSGGKRPRYDFYRLAQINNPKIYGLAAGILDDTYVALDVRLPTLRAESAIKHGRGETRRIDAYNLYETVDLSGSLSIGRERAKTVEAFGRRITLPIPYTFPYTRIWVKDVIAKGYHVCLGEGRTYYPVINRDGETAAILHQILTKEHRFEKFICYMEDEHYATAALLYGVFIDAYRIAGIETQQPPMVIKERATRNPTLRAKLDRPFIDRVMGMVSGT